MELTEEKMSESEVRKYILDKLKRSHLNVYQIVTATGHTVNEVNAILRELQKSHKILPNPVTYRLA